MDDSVLGASGIGPNFRQVLLVGLTTWSGTNKETSSGHLHSEVGTQRVNTRYAAVAGNSPVKAGIPSMVRIGLKESGKVGEKQAPMR